MAELKILNNRSGMIFNLIKKNHMAVMIREGQDASQTFTDASILKYIKWEIDRWKI